ncbi:MAG: hypothetical protein LBN27_10065, partial [Prevotellaceae bacterium]|nr:hypothetical protein [Prevotellaceae bacterium]
MRFFFIIFVLICLLTTCGKREKRDSQALFDRIKSSVEQQQFNLAKQQIDSLNTLFRENIPLRKSANKMLYEIELAELQRNMAYFSELIPRKKLEMDSIFRYFTFDKTEPYQNEGEYIHRDIARANNPTATYLKAHLKDSGEVFLISIYCGWQDCPYQSIKVSSSEFFVASPEISLNKASNYAFSDGSLRWRMLLFSEEESIEIIRFVAAHANEEITVSLSGKDCAREYVLDEKYKKAIRDTYYLSALIREVRDLRVSVENTKKQ